MGSERGATEYFFENSGALDEREPRHFFLDRDAELDPEVRRLQDLLQRKMPAIRGLLRRLLRDDSDLPEYMDRIYGRLRGALRSDTSLDETAIWRVRFQSCMRIENVHGGEGRTASTQGV